jgi:hypothetical protein
MSHPALIHDQLDDRRELVTLLNHLPPRQRVAFLQWACSRATVPNSRVSPAPPRRPDLPWLGLPGSATPRTMGATGRPE